MLQLYVRIHTWLTATMRQARNNDRGSISVEQAVITAVLVTAALLVSSAIFALVQSRASSIQP
jgi:hypothetical protein